MTDNSYRLTPFIEKLLSLVRDTCDPHANEWAAALGKKIYQEFYQLRQPGDHLEAETNQIESFKLQAVEEKLSASLTLPRNLSEVHNRPPSLLAR